jgi:hypothetical protein
VTPAAALWSFGFLGLLLAAALLFRKLRRGTIDYQDSMAARSRMPSWARVVEKVALWSFVLATGFVVVVAFHQIYELEHPGRHIVGATAVFATFGAILIAFPIGALLANLLSWILPPIRTANEAAMAGTEVSFTSANRGLLQFALVSVPVGVAALALAAIAPWGM